MANDKKDVVTIGYVPLTFPRDPIYVNYVEEHTILGQIIEPILDSDQNGNLDAGIAENWSFSSDGKKIQLNIKKGKLFSSGKELEADDVVYSIKRHLENTNSQSFQFLKDIEDIEAKGPHKLEISLKRQNPSVLKALTRDQLGIVPKGWIFNAQSSEPFVGTGPYRAKKENSKWYLVANEKYNGSYPPTIKRFELVFYLNNDFSLPVGSLPDVIPDLSDRAMNSVKNNKKFLEEGYQIQKKISFTQTSFWVYPKSSLYLDADLRRTVATIFNEAILTYVKSANLVEATGMVPVGIQGYLPKRIENPVRNHAAKKRIIVRFGFLPGVFSEFLSNSEVKEVFNKYSLDIVPIPFNPQTLEKLHDSKPDIVTGSWAGGFNDPMGFLGLLNQLLGISFDQYLSGRNLSIAEASNEANWTSRADKFRKLSEKVVIENLNIPGWRTSTYFVAKNNISEKKSEFRYTPRFNNIQKR